VSKNSKHWSNEKGPSSTTKIVQRNNSDRSNNAYGYKYFSLLLFYPFVVPADLSQQAKSAAADGLTYSDSIDKKVRKIYI
jgi:hypothetical protein